MPEKEGDDDKKSTKSVVNKRQKQMMGEEGYDIARDMGKVKPSKDKKDATTMPVSDEVKKTQKVNKGPSAFERVKAKYGKSVMNVGKKKANEELDLTQVAEALGGYIVEAPMKSLTGDPEEISSKIKKAYSKTRKIKQDTEAADQAAKVSQARRKLKINTTEKPAEVKGREDATNPKEGGYSRVDDTIDAPKQKGIKFGDTPGAGPVRSYNVKDLNGKKEKPKPSTPRGNRAKRVRGASGEKPTGSIARGTYKSSPEGQKAYDAKKADLEARQGIKDAGGTGDIGFKAPNRAEKIKKRTDRADALDIPDPFSPENPIDTSRAAADNAKRFGTPVPPRRPRFNPTEPFQDDDSGLYTAPGGKGKDKGVPQKDRPKAQKPPSGAYSRVGGQREVIGKVDTKVTGGEYGKLRSDQTVDQSAFDQAQSGRDLQGNPLTTSQRKQLLRRSRGVDSDSVKNVSKNLTKGGLSSELKTGGGFDTGRSGESITRRPSQSDASPNITVNVNQPKRDIDVKKTAGQIGRKFSDVATDAARSQSQSMMGAMGGMIGKSAFPDVAGAEAGVNLARGDKLGAALSLGQSLGGSLGFAAGVANAIRMRMPNYKVPKPVTPKFDPRSGGKLAKQGQVSTDTATGEREAKMSVGGMALGRVLRNVKAAAKQNARRATSVRGGRAIQVSAGK